jgi:outer membrane receptor for ferrienterochelin and colicin
MSVLQKLVILKIFLPVLLLFLHPVFSGANPEGPKKVTISGFVKDQTNGEILIGATVFCMGLHKGVVTNVYGFYSLSLEPGKYSIRFSYVGYEQQEMEVQIRENLVMDISLQPLPEELGEVVVRSKRADQNVTSAEMSFQKVDSKTIQKIPSLLGEIDLIKVIQLMPGVLTTSEGSTGFSVRGGQSDQNLIILDEATIYNASHLMGFFSVFNNDAVKDVTLYKGDIPAAYGGRLSSLLDVRMKDGNARKLAASGSIGTVSSKLTLEGPLKRDKTTFILSGRRTYADLFLPLAKNEDIRDNRLYFYDLNLKLTHMFNNKNRVFFTGYIGRDVFKNQYALMGFGNQSASLRWNHLFSSRLFFNLSLNYSQYSYELGTIEDTINSFKWTSVLRDYSLRLDFTHFLSSKHTLRFGAVSVFHSFFPGSVKGIGESSIFTGYVLTAQYALEHALYASDEMKITDKLTIKAGLRWSLFQNIGPGKYTAYDADFNPGQSIQYGKGDIYNTWSRLEPRLAMTYLIDGTSSVKGSYSHTGQFIMLAQNSTAGTPLDVWFPASPNIKPQLCDQLALGYFRNFFQNKLEVSAEVYHKGLRQIVDFRENAQLLLNEHLEGELRFGKGSAYGAEVMIRKNDGRLTGWISYTYSRSFRKVPQINEGKLYKAPFDKPHTVNIVTNYDLSKRLSASVTWVYATGLPVTFPIGRAVFGNAILPVYSERNAFRMPDYHRMDASLTLKGRKKPGKKWQGEWNLSVYNLYDRHNTWSINFVRDAKNPNVTYAEKTYLFSVIPAITYNFKF